MGANQQGSRERLLRAAKSLFAERGYELTTRAAIARAAKTSQSQFIKHFVDKRGVLAAIYEQAWSEIVSAVRLATDRIAAPLDKFRLLVDMLLSYLARDAQFRRIALAAGPCVSSADQPARADAAFAEFLGMIDDILQQMRNGGELLANVNVRVLRGALLGALFGMLADVEQQRSSGAVVAYSESEVTAMVFRFMLAWAPAASVAPAREPVDAGEDTWVSNYLNLASKVLGPRGTA